MNLPVTTIIGVSILPGGIKFICQRCGITFVTGSVRCTQGNCSAISSGQRRFGGNNVAQFFQIVIIVGNRIVPEGRGGFQQRRILQLQSQESAIGFRISIRVREVSRSNAYLTICPSGRMVTMFSGICLPLFSTAF